MEKLLSPYKIGVFGSAAGSELEVMKNYAFSIGRLVADEKAILCTGACPGIPHYAALGAFKSGGLVLGFSPAIDLNEHIARYNFPVKPYILIFTGMERKGRNLINLRTCDAAIFISGRMGTLNEFTIIHDEGEGKVIGLLRKSGGAVDNLIIPFLGLTEKKPKAEIIIETDQLLLVEKIIKSLKKSRL